MTKIHSRPPQLPFPGHSQSHLGVWASITQLIGRPDLGRRNSGPVVRAFHYLSAFQLEAY